MVASEGPAATIESDPARQFPNFTLEQLLASHRAEVAKLHPEWKNLSWPARVTRFAKIVSRAILAQAVPAVPSASFIGNLTLVNGTSTGGFYLFRQDDCSLTRYSGSYSLSTTPGIQISDTTAHIESSLHDAAGLNTTGGVSGCADSSVGIGARRSAYLGKTTQNGYLVANVRYDGIAGGNVLDYGVVDPAAATDTLHDDQTDPNLERIAIGDLDGDGLNDVVGINVTNTASISVWLAKSDGTLGAPTTYPLSGDQTGAAVLADFNGDGKVDVAVAVRTAKNGGGSQESIAILTGKGDGTLNAAQSFDIPTPSGAQTIVTLIAANLRGSGKNDLVASNGLVLLNDGSGTFTVAGTTAFPPTFATSNSGPNMAAADFNKDGKLDLAVGDGDNVSIYLGAGDGTFALAHRYASIDTVGYLSASDLDGDGNLDLYVGQGNGGAFSGDQFETNKAYALMGNGDGSFQGAPSEPFLYTGTNLADLDGDGHPDAVGVNPDLSFTSYLADAQGQFTAKATLATSPIVLDGQSYALNNIDSYALGDVNGDGKADLVYIAQNFYGPGFLAGVFIALGKGDGTFNAPTFYGVPNDSNTLSGEPLDINPILSNIRLVDVDGDGAADLIYAYSTAGSHNYYLGTAVQRSNGDGATFKAPQTVLFYSDSSSTFLTSKVFAVTDVNGDGKPDLLLLTESAIKNNDLNAFPFTVQIALGNGDGSFGTPANVTTADFVSGIPFGTQSAPVVVADMNNDGKPDLVAIGAGSTGDIQVAIALGKGNGTFNAPIKTNFGAEYLPFDSIAVADFDGDGKPDVFISGFFGAEGNGISFGNGNGTLSTATLNSEVVPAQGVILTTASSTTAYDANGDGKPDVLAGTTLLLSTAATAPPSADFSLTESNASGSAAAGQSATTTLTLTPSGGFSGTVALSCSGLPAGAACKFTPASVTVNGAAANSTLEITTATRVAQSVTVPGQPLDPFLPTGTFLATLGSPLVVRRQARRSKPARMLAWLMLAALCAGTLVACGGGGSSSGGGGTSGGTPAGNYTVTVKATSGALSHSLSYALTVS